MFQSVERIKPILIFNILGMVIFSMGVCFTKDIVTSKVSSSPDNRLFQCIIGDKL